LSGAPSAGHDDRVIAGRFSEKPVGLQLDAFLGKDIEIAVRSNGFDIDFLRQGFLAAVLKTSSGAVISLVSIPS
jgi:hypothetical protein